MQLESMHVFWFTTDSGGFCPVDVIAFPFLGVNPNGIASLTYCMMSLKVYRRVKEERKKKERPFSRVALAVSSRRKASTLLFIS